MKTLVFIFIFLFSTTSVWGSEDSFIKNKLKNKMRLFAISDFSFIQSPGNGDDLTSFGLSFMGRYAFHDQYAIGVSIRQSFSIGGTSVITSFEGSLTYALTGKLSVEDQNYNLAGKEVVSMKDLDTDGIRLTLSSVQYYFNASTNTVPYNGFGLGAYYEYSLANKDTIIAGGKYEYISNTTFSTSPLILFIGYGVGF
jgi:hypothetical protein